MATHKLIIGWERLPIENKILRFMQKRTFSLLNNTFFDVKDFNALPKEKKNDPHQVLEYMEGTYEECDLIRTKLFSGNKQKFKELLESIKNSKVLRAIPSGKRRKVLSTVNSKNLSNYNKIENTLFSIGIFFYVDIREIEDSIKP
jgi:hypothetical protein